MADTSKGKVFTDSTVTAELANAEAATADAVSAAAAAVAAAEALEDLVDDLGTGLGTLSGATISDDQLEEMALAEAFTISSITRDAGTGLPTAATLAWRDGSGGAFTGTVSSGDGGYSSVVFTHTASGKTATITITRSGGQVTATAIAIT